MAKGKTFLNGFLIGSVVAGAAALLSAPKSGNELRNTIKNNQGQIVNTLQRVKSEGQDLAEQIQKTSKEGIQVMKEVSEDVQLSVGKWKEEITPHQRNIQDELNNIKQSFDQLERKSNNEN